MRYTCLDVRSPYVNFLRKVMSSSRHGGAAYSRHPCRQSADADIVSAFPLSFNTFLENINILRQTSSTWHRILREFCVLESFQKPVALAGYKNKQCRKQTLVLSGRIVTAYVPLRSATERERAAFLIPCQGLRDYFTNSQVNNLLFSKQRAQNTSLDDLGTGVDELTLDLGLSALCGFFLLFLSCFPLFLFLLYRKFL